MLFIQDAYAQAAGGAAQPGGGISPIIMMVGIFAIMWFFMFRPQQKKMKEHQALIAGLKRGDEVITGGGLMGRIVNLDAYAIDLEIAKNTVVRIQRPFVTQVLPKGSLKAALGSDTQDNGKKNDKKSRKAEQGAANDAAPANSDSEATAAAETASTDTPASVQEEEKSADTQNNAEKS